MVTSLRVLHFIANGCEVTLRKVDIKHNFKGEIGLTAGHRGGKE